MGLDSRSTDVTRFRRLAWAANSGARSPRHISYHRLARHISAGEWRQRAERQGIVVHFEAAAKPGAPLLLLVCVPLFDSRHLADLFVVGAELGEVVNDGRRDPVQEAGGDKLELCEDRHVRHCYKPHIQKERPR
jgi:hypothetical protein